MRITLLLAAFFLAPALLAADDAEEIKKQVPAATSMKLEDFRKLAESATSPKASDVEEQSFSLMLLAMNPFTDDEEELAEYAFPEDAIPRPSAIAEEYMRSRRAGSGVPEGRVTGLRLESVSAVTANVEGDTASGIVEFLAPNLYQGKFHYKARKTGAGWRIVEISLPARKIKLASDAEGVWRTAAAADTP